MTKTHDIVPQIPLRPQPHKAAIVQIAKPKAEVPHMGGFDPFVALVNKQAKENEEFSRSPKAQNFNSLSLLQNELQIQALHQQ